MPLSGTLQDLSLPSLIQLQCGEQRPAQVRLTRRGREAILGFANGELVHARVGSRTGDEAVFELVGWEDAEFQVTYTISPLEQNVITPWTALLLEGMRRLDETRAQRNPAYEALAQQLGQQRGLQAALVFCRTSLTDAAATETQRLQDAEWIADITERAQAIGNILELGQFNEIVKADAKEKLWIQALNETLVAGWLDGRATLESLRSIVQSQNSEKAE
jgi:hypothetical protein